MEITVRIEDLTWRPTQRRLVGKGFGYYDAVSVVGKTTTIQFVKKGHGIDPYKKKSKNCILFVPNPANCPVDVADIILYVH